MTCNGTNQQGALVLGHSHLDIQSYEVGIAENVIATKLYWLT